MADLIHNEKQWHANAGATAEQSCPQLDAIGTMMAIARLDAMLRAAASRRIGALGLPNNLSGARFTLLATLYFARGKRLTQKEIGRALSVSRTNITNLIDGLEREGLVKRTFDPADRRVSYPRLTRAGELACRIAMPEMAHLMIDLIDGFTVEETTRFREYLYRVQRNLVRRHPAGFGKGIIIED